MNNSYKCTKMEKIPDVILIGPRVFSDTRGFFLEIFQKEKYAKGGINQTFVQDNHSHSKQGVIRGLHYQLKHPQGKLIYVVTGEIYDVAVDIRKGSSTFGEYVGVNLSAKNKLQLYIPEGFAHGLCALSKEADVMYKCTDYYNPDDEYGIKWSDPKIGIDWPVTGPNIDKRDSEYPILENVPAENLPKC